METKFSRPMLLLKTMSNSIPNRLNLTLFQTKMVKIYTLFQTILKQLENMPFSAAHTYLAYIREYPSLPRH